MFLIHFSQDIYKEFLHTEKEKDHYFRIFSGLMGIFQVTAKCNALKSFPLRVSLVSVTKSAISCGLSHFTEETPNRKVHFLCSGNAKC